MQIKKTRLRPSTYIGPILHHETVVGGIDIDRRLALRAGEGSDLPPF